MIRVGTAGWQLPRGAEVRFGQQGSHLERYAQIFNAVEVNSTFYKLPQRGTLERWRLTTPDDFSFSLKMPRSITHEAKLTRVQRELDGFLDLASVLEAKLGVILVQLPPSFAYDRRKTKAFLSRLRARFAGAVAWEPRHPTWGTDSVSALLGDYDVSRVAADPAPFPGAELPAASPRVAYYRLHGSPRMYYSEYTEPYLSRLTETLLGGAAETGDSWCVFDNTALGAALHNALDLVSRIPA